MPWLLGLCGVICSMGMAWLLHFFQPGENPMISQVPAQPSDAKFRSSPVIDSVLVRRQGAWSQGGKGRGQVKPHPRPACLQVGEVETHALLMRASKSITEEGLSGSDPGTQEGFSKEVTLGPWWLSKSLMYFGERRKNLTFIKCQLLSLGLS